MNNIGDWIESLLRTVPNSNVIFPYIREVRSAQQLVQDFGTKQLDNEGVEITRGWMIKVKSYKPALITFDGTAECRHDVQIEGLSSLHSRGASGREFEEHAKAVAVVLNAWQSPPDSLPSVEIIELAQLVSLSERIWPATGGRIHHHALIQLVVKTSEKVKQEI